MNAGFFERIAELERAHASFAIATVVARQAPVSSHLGDRALVFADGRMEGFVGGSCSRDIVRRQALRAVAQRQPLLLQIRHDARSAAEGSCDAAADEGESRTVPATECVVIPMSCSSEGAVDIYIEPRVPLRRLLVVGFTPVAEAVARLGSVLDYSVTRVVSEDEMRDLGSPAGVQTLGLGALRDFLAVLDSGQRESLIAVVASQGHYDELALEALQAHDIAFTGLLASRRRASTVLGVLAQQGVPADRLARIRCPVGLDIGARSPGEVAVSILAEIIGNTPQQLGPLEQGRFRGRTTLPAGRAGATAIDPVCAMEVDTAQGASIASSMPADTMVFLLRRLPRVVYIRSEPQRYLEPSPSVIAATYPRVVCPAWLHHGRYDLGTALELALALEKPLLIEGPAGVGKTESAKVLADALGHAAHSPAVL